MPLTPIAADIRNQAENANHRTTPSVADTFRRDQGEFEANFDTRSVATPGTTIADTPLLDPFGQTVNLYELIAGPCVLVFYRGSWCTNCNIVLRAYQAALLPELNARGIALLALSPQKPDGSMSMKEKHELQYLVMSDPTNCIASQLGIVRATSTEALSAYADIGIDLAETNANETVSLPLPTVALVDKEMTIRWIDVRLGSNSRTEVEEILSAVDRVKL